MNFVSLALLFFSLCVAVAHAAPTLTVDGSRVLRSGADEVVGVNLNYLRDADANRPDARPMSEALSEMNARWLRYPGGEKSDWHLWSAPPYDEPAPVALGWYASVPGAKLDFDAYIALTRRVGARPYVVVGYDSLKRSGRTREQWLENAVSWVRYARASGAKVRHWEIGNENWHNQSATPEEMAEIVVEFARAMKAADPDILIGASGDPNFWPHFLPVAAPALDFVSLSLYNAWNWKSYDFLLANPNTDLIAGARAALKAIDKYAPAADRARLQVVVAETNSKDYSQGGWGDANNWGHAIVLFETLGRLMAQPRVQSAMVWTTRWVEDTPARSSQWYVLGEANELLATGRAIELWQGAQSEMLAVQGNAGALQAYATRAPDRSALTLWIVNRGPEPIADVEIELRALPQFQSASVRRLSGTGPDDINPTWTDAPPIIEAARLTGLQCPPFSVSVIALSNALPKPSGI